MSDHWLLLSVPEVQLDASTPGQQHLINQSEISKYFVLTNQKQVEEVYNQNHRCKKFYEEIILCSALLCFIKDNKTRLKHFHQSEISIEMCQPIRSEYYLSIHLHGSSASELVTQEISVVAGGDEVVRERLLHVIRLEQLVTGHDQVVLR